MEPQEPVPLSRKHPKRPAAGRPRWLFAYGSLMWRPGFTPAERAGARLAGWHRALCVRSEYYRGTKRRPGAILGLLAGGSCRGFALRLPERGYDRLRAYLWQREIEHDGVYLEMVRWVTLDDGRRVRALVYIADRHHPQFAGKLPPARAATLVRQGRGATGSNLNYLAQTVAGLAELGLRSAALDAVARRVGL